MSIKERLKNPTVWLSIASLILFILKVFGLFKFIGITPDEYNSIFVSIIGILTTIGVLNNPEKESFLQEKNK